MPLTPASSNEAMPVRIAAAARSSGQASRAPVPSPRRRPSCNSGSACKASSIKAWPGSAPIWENTSRERQPGSSCKAASAAAVAMNPSTRTMRRDSAAPSMAPANMAISKPPYSASASVGSSLPAVRAAACERTFRLRSTPPASRPAPGPVNSASGNPSNLCASMVAEELLAMPISPRQSTLQSTSRPSSRPRSSAVSHCFIDIAGPSAKFQVPGPMRRSSSSGCASGSRMPASTSVTGTSRVRANAVAAAPPSRKLRAICIVTACGNADTPASAMP